MSKKHPKMRLEWTNGASVEIVCDREIPPTWDAAMTAAFNAYHATDKVIPAIDAARATMTGGTDD